MQKAIILLCDSEFLAWIDTEQGLVFDSFSCINFSGDLVQILDSNDSGLRYVTNFYYHKRDHLGTLLQFINSEFASNYPYSHNALLEFVNDFERLERYFYKHSIEGGAMN